MPSFRIEDLERSVMGRASDAHQIVEKHQGVGQKAVGQVRRDKRRLKSDSEKLIREFIRKQKDPFVFLDICDYLERRPSPVLRAIVAEMVARGELIQEDDFGAGPLIARHVYRRPGR